MFKLVARRFASTLTFVESHNGVITPQSLSALNAALKVNQPVTALFMSNGSLDQVKSHFGAFKSQNALFKNALFAGDAKFEHLMPETASPVVTDLLKTGEYSHFFVPSSFIGKALLPRVASEFDVQPLSDIVSVVAPDTFQRYIYAGNALATVKSSDKLILASVRASAFDPVAVSESESADVESVSVESSEVPSSAEFVGENLLQSERPSLTSAKVVVSGGRGLGSKEKFEELLGPLAKKLNAAIGASRAAVDAGYVDNSLQVGQTGKIIAPDLYIAVGISGAIQHLAGMKDSKVIVAINKSEDAAIFNVADYGLVGDLFEIVPELTEKL